MTSVFKLNFIIFVYYKCIAEDICPTYSPLIYYEMSFIVNIKSYRIYRARARACVYVCVLSFYRY